MMKFGSFIIVILAFIIAVEASITCTTAGVGGIGNLTKSACFVTTNGSNWVQVDVRKAAVVSLGTISGSLYACDQSLSGWIYAVRSSNLSAIGFTEQGKTMMLFGDHDVNCTTTLSGTSVSFGNQWPSSITLGSGDLLGLAADCDLKIVSYNGTDRWTVGTSNCSNTLPSGVIRLKDAVNSIGGLMTTNDLLGNTSSIVSVTDSTCYTTISCDGGNCVFDYSELVSSAFDGSAMHTCVYNSSCVNTSSVAAQAKVDDLNHQLNVSQADVDVLTGNVTGLLNSISSTRDSAMMNLASIVNTIGFHFKNCSTGVDCNNATVNDLVFLVKMMYNGTFLFGNETVQYSEVANRTNEVLTENSNLVLENSEKDSTISNLTNQLNSCQTKLVNSLGTSVDNAITADDKSSGGLDFTLPTILIIALGSLATFLVLIIASLSIYRAFKKGRASWSQTRD